MCVGVEWCGDPDFYGVCASELLNIMCLCACLLMHPAICAHQCVFFPGLLSQCAHI